MLLIRCPMCANETRVPPSILGKKVRCKNPDCGQAFAAVEGPAPAAVVAQPVLPEMFSPGTPEPGRIPFDDPVSADRPDPQTRTSKPRYPNLVKYLDWGRSIARVQLALFLLLAIGVFLSSWIRPLSNNMPFQQAIVPILTGLFMSLLISVSAYILYVFTMAGIEFVHVILDVESNTRRIASEPSE